MTKWLWQNVGVGKQSKITKKYYLNPLMSGKYYQEKIDNHSIVLLRD
jgi:hypothetical protein